MDGWMDGWMGGWNGWMLCIQGTDRLHVVKIELRRHAAAPAGRTARPSLGLTIAIGRGGGIAVGGDGCGGNGGEAALSRTEVVLGQTIESQGVVTERLEQTARQRHLAVSNKSGKQ